MAQIIRAAARVSLGRGNDDLLARHTSRKVAARLALGLERGNFGSLERRLLAEDLRIGLELLAGHFKLLEDAPAARVEIAAWVEDYNRERPHSALGYATPAEFAAELNKQWPASLRPTGSATQPIASTALMRKKTARL